MSVFFCNDEHKCIKKHTISQHSTGQHVLQRINFIHNSYKQNSEFDVLKILFFLLPTSTRKMFPVPIIKGNTSSVQCLWTSARPPPPPFPLPTHLLLLLPEHSCLQKGTVLNGMVMLLKKKKKKKKKKKSGWMVGWDFKTNVTVQVKFCSICYAQNVLGHKWNLIMCVRIYCK